jgi:hypothetical protein
MMSWLLPYATTGLSRIAGWGLIDAPPRGQPRMPAMMLPQALPGSPSAPPINAQRVARFDHYRARNCLPPQKLRREIQ